MPDFLPDRSRFLICHRETDRGMKLSAANDQLAIVKHVLDAAEVTLCVLSFTRKERPSRVRRATTRWIARTDSTGGSNPHV